MKKKVGIYYDFQNVYDNANNDNKEYKIQINFIENYCKELGKIKVKNLYLKKGKYSNEDEIIQTHKNNYLYDIIVGPIKKDIDTLMTSDIVEDGSRNLFDICVIISGDTDFIAPIKKLINMKKEVYVLCNSNTYRKNQGITEYATDFKILPKMCKRCNGEGIIIESCNKCNGSGEYHATCSKCDGKGWIGGGFCRICNGTGWIAEECRKCEGTGIKSTSECTKCGGVGKIEEVYCQNCLGTGKTIEVCNTCEGKGLFFKEKCVYCEGKGFIDLSKRKICNSCNGTGIYSTDECWTCNGTGIYKNERGFCHGEGIIHFE